MGEEGGSFKRYLKAGALTRCLKPLLSKGMVEGWIISGMAMRVSAVHLLVPEDVEVMWSSGLYVGLIVGVKQEVELMGREVEEGEKSYCRQE